jgi:osmoprotectant transport system substrate-binding protein
MPRPRLRSPAPWVLVLTLALTVGCGSDESDEDSVVEGVDLTGVDITVGSKDFTEQQILGEITLQVLTAAGANVTDRLGMESTEMARQALLAGAVDMYWEYTGTAWTTMLGHQEPIGDPQEQFEAVAAEDGRQNDITWLAPPAPADNAYAIAIRGDASDPDSEEYDPELAEVRSLSDLADLAGRSPDKATLCVATEFANRADGLPGLAAAYGLQLPADAVITLDHESLIYDAVANGSACNFGEVFRTDSRIDSLDLRLVDDDQDFFAVYNPCLTVRSDLLDEHPEIEEMFAPIAAALDDETLRELNGAVDVDDDPVRDVVRNFLQDEGFLSPRQLSK